MFIGRTEECVYRSDDELEGHHAQRIFVPIRGRIVKECIIVGWIMVGSFYALQFHSNDTAVYYGKPPKHLAEVEYQWFISN